MTMWCFTSVRRRSATGSIPSYYYYSHNTADAHNTTILPTTVYRNTNINFYIVYHVASVSTPHIIFKAASNLCLLTPVIGTYSEFFN